MFKQDEEGASEPVVVEEEPIPDVHDLVFKDVGIQSWKVKVGIGLVYDFDDYKTLRTYMKNGRVSDTDSLSSDGGENWIEISGLADLEQHFIDVYVDARRAQNQSKADAAAEQMVEVEETEEVEEVEEVDADAIADALLDAMQAEENGEDERVESDPESIADDLLAAVEAAAVAETEGIDLDMDSLLEAAVEEVEQQKPPTPASRGREQTAIESVVTRTGNEEAAGHQFVDPFEALQQQRQARSRARSTRGKGRGKGKKGQDQTEKHKRLILGTVAALFLGVLFLSFGESDVPEVSSNQVRKHQEAIKTANLAKSKENARKKMQAQLNEALRDVQVDEIDAFEVEEDLLIARVPDEFRKGRPPSAPSGVIGVPPSPMAGIENGLAPFGPETQSNMTARDYLQIGDQAARGQRWAEAETAYSAALQIEPRNAEIRSRYGRSLFRKGDMGQGEVELRRAAAEGALTAYKYLGHLAGEQGDVAGANAHYQTYLRSNPSDGAAIQSLVDQLSP